MLSNNGLCLHTAVQYMLLFLVLAVNSTWFQAARFYALLLQCLDTKSQLKTIRARVKEVLHMAKIQSGWPHDTKGKALWLCILHFSWGEGVDVGFLVHADSRVWYKCFVFVTRLSFSFLPKEGGKMRLYGLLGGASMYLCAKHVAN